MKAKDFKNKLSRCYEKYSGLFCKLLQRKIMINSMYKHFFSQIIITYKNKNQENIMKSMLLIFLKNY